MKEIIAGRFMQFVDSKEPLKFVAKTIIDNAIDNAILSSINGQSLNEKSDDYPLFFEIVHQMESTLSLLAESSYGTHGVNLEIIGLQMPLSEGWNQYMSNLISNLKEKLLELKN